MFIKAAPGSAGEYANYYILWQSLTSSAAFWLRTKDGPDTDTVAVLFSIAGCSPSASCEQQWLCSVYCVSSSTSDSTGDASHMTVWRRDYTGLFITSSCHSFSAVYPLKPPFHFSDVSTVYQTSILTNHLVSLQVSSGGAKGWPGMASRAVTQHKPHSLIIKYAAELTFRPFAMPPLPRWASN